MDFLYKKLSKRSEKGSLPIIWAFDPILDDQNPFDQFLDIFSEINEIISGIKFNRQLILPWGLQHPKLTNIIDKIIEKDIPLIMDAKINDIGYTNYSISANYFSAGFDAVICNPFIGNSALEPIIQASNDFKKSIILLVYMSHPSANFGYGRLVNASNEEKKIFKSDSVPFYKIFANLVNELNLSGGIIGGTAPNIIKEVRDIFSSNKLIISPGIGAQGGDAKQAKNAGMDYAIIGRSITQNPDRIKLITELFK